MITELVELFVGSAVEDPNEARFLGRLREDLERAGVRARIHANFLAGRDPRQVDFLISTESRLVQVELKCLDPNRRLIAGVNGPWQQICEDGEIRRLGTYFDQAHQATYRIGDEMTALARKGEVPHPRERYYKDIDTIVLIYPVVPKNSVLKKHKYVDVIGYSDLLARLTTPGPQPQWTSQHWDAFSRHLTLYQPDPEQSPSERARRDILRSAADYRLRFASHMNAALHEYVPVNGSFAGHPDFDLRQALQGVLSAGGTATVTAASGGGKSHLAKHVATALAATGQVPLYVQCSAHYGRSFPDLLRSAAAPYTTERVVEFIEGSSEAGAPSVFILDGLNECSPTLRDDLLSKLAAFRLRHPGGVLITSTESVALPDVDGPVAVHIYAPVREEREQILRSYGAEPTEALLAFERPFDLAIAAEVYRDLPSRAPRGLLYDAFIRNRANEEMRTALRMIAAHIGRELRSSLTVAETQQLLRAPGTLAAPVIDRILTNPLLKVNGNRVSFTHDLIGRYLVAEEVVLSSPNVDDIAERLADPRYTDLRDLVVSCEPQPDRAHALLRHLADRRLLQSASEGAFGRRVAEFVDQDILSALSSAAWDTYGADLVPDDAPYRAMCWETHAEHTLLDEALLLTAWHCLGHAGRFGDEIAELLSASDEVCAAQIERLSSEGVTSPINMVVGATYGSFAGATLPATVMLKEHVMGIAYGEPLDLTTVTSIWSASAGPGQWGRILAAMRLTQWRGGSALSIVPDLIEAGWNTGSYDVQLETLTLAHAVARQVKHQATRQRIVDFLIRIEDPGLLSLSGLLIDALAEYGEIDALTTREDILQEVQEILTAPQDSRSQALAQHMFSARYDRQNVVGPYYETIEELSESSLLALAVVALSAAEPPVSFPNSVLQILTRSASPDSPPNIRAVIRRYADTIDLRSPSARDSAAMHLEAVRGLAMLDEPLRPPTDQSGTAQPGWGLVDAALYSLYRDDTPPSRSPEQIARWRSNYGQVVVTVTCIAKSEWLFEGQTRKMWPYQLLRVNCPDYLREVFEQALVTPDGIPDRSRFPTRTQVLAFAVQELGDLGNGGSIAILRSLFDGEHGPSAATSVRVIESRLDKTA